MTQVQQFRETSASAKPNSASHLLIEKQSSHGEEREPASYVLGNEQRGALSLGGLSEHLSCERPTDCYRKAVSRRLGVRD